ncbi:MAG: CBS domain-containing protein, partial [Chloroflexi bacterium]|nr:CBS domain-containing protein [Chloroflexota bacterium]
LVDDEERPLGWIDRHDLEGDGMVDPDAATPGAPTVQPETTLRDALSMMLGSSVQLGVVVDERDRVIGAISVDAISEALRAPGRREAPRLQTPEGNNGGSEAAT